MLTGIAIGSLWDTTPADLVESWVEDNEETEQVQVILPDGEGTGSDEQVATGMLPQAVSATGSVLQQSAIVVMGDVLGTGEISLSQVVRIAKAYTGADPLEGAYLRAGDLAGDSAIQLTDVINVVQIYIRDAFVVNCTVTRQDVGTVLQEAGYDIAPWTEEVAVLTANIPDGARIRSIEWVQHDVFPGGREQTLCYDGPEKTLIFGTYAEGSTTVTAVVTTEAGKTGGSETVIVWTPGTASQRSGEPYAIAVSHDTSYTVRTSSRPSATPSATKVTTATGEYSSAWPTSTASAASSSARPTPTASGTARPSSPSGAPSPADLLNTFRAEVLLGTNSLRTNNGISPMLIESKRLSEAAMVRAAEMAKAGKLSHTRPDGSKYSTVVELGKGVVIGENIHSNKGYPTLQVAQIAVKGWENSAPHRKQILEGRYSYTGIGFVQAEDSKWYCVQVFSNGDKVLSIDSPKSA